MSSLPVSTTTAYQPKPRTNFTIDFLLGNDRSPRDVEDSTARVRSLPVASFTSTTTIHPFVLSEPLLVKFANDLKKTAINRSDSINGLGLQRTVAESSCWYRSTVDGPTTEFIPALKSFNALRAAQQQHSPCSPLSQQQLVAPLANLNKFDPFFQRNIKSRWLPSDKDDSSFTPRDGASLEAIRNAYSANREISDVKGESKWCCQPVCRYGYGSTFHYKRKRFRTAFTASQMARLESSFRHSRYAIGSERRTLSRDLGLTETQVKVWFQNRRTKYRKIRELCTGERGQQLMPSLYCNKPESPSSTSTTSPLSFPRSTCCDVSVARQRTPAYNVTGCWSPPTVESSTIDDFS